MCLFLLSFWCVDHFYMKKIINTYSTKSPEFEAFKKGAYMGIAKTIIMMGALFTISLTVSAYNNAQYKSEEIIKNYLNYPMMNNHDNFIHNNDTIFIDSLNNNMYILHK